MKNGSTTWSFAYNADGQRIRRTNGSTKYTYYYTGGNLRYMTVGAAKLFFILDASGQPTELYYRSGAVDTYYYYVRNIQGDIIALLDTSGNKVVEYTYDAWGNILSITGSLASTVGVQNPFRYRGYVYDDETGLYYCQSRYYDPEMGRFINADAFASTGQGILGNNMFAYCNNNPVINHDPTGNLRTSCLMVSDSGYNTQARAYLAKKQLDGSSENARYFLSPWYSVSVPFENGDVRLSGDFSLSHGELPIREDGDTFLTIDVLRANAGLQTGLHGISSSLGLDFIGGSISLYFKEIEIESGLAVGIGFTKKFTSDGFKHERNVGPINYFIAVQWYDSTMIEGYIH